MVHIKKKNSTKQTAQYSPICSSGHTGRDGKIKE